MNALPKGETKAQIDDGVLGREQYAKQQRDFAAHCMRLGQVFVEPGHEPRAHAKSVHSPRTGQDALGKRISLGVNLQDLGLVASLDCARNGHDDDGRRRDAQRDERQLPVCGKGDGKGGDKGRQALERQAKFLRDAALDQAPARGGLRGDGAALSEVIVGGFLAEGGAEVGVADVAHDAVGVVVEEDVVQVCEDEPSDAEVDKIQAASKSTITYR